MIVAAVYSQNRASVILYLQRSSSGGNKSVCFCEEWDEKSDAALVSKCEADWEK